VAGHGKRSLNKRLAKSLKKKQGQKPQKKTGAKAEKRTGAHGAPTKKKPGAKAEKRTGALLFSAYGPGSFSGFWPLVLCAAGCFRGFSVIQNLRRSIENL